MPKKKFKRYSDGAIIELDRETKTLTFEGVEPGNFFKGKNHNFYEFRDENRVLYRYCAPIDYSGVPLTKLGQDLENRGGENLKLTISGYFIPAYYTPNCIYIENIKVINMTGGD